MTHQEKIDWMIRWCHANKVVLELEGSCGFGRECVGIIADGHYADYRWYNSDYSEQLDQNGNVWVPADAYHKHECVAVLGHGENAESQLYEWLKWFSDNGFVVEVGERVPKNRIDAAIHGMKTLRMVKKVAA